MKRHEPVADEWFHGIGLIDGVLSRGVDLEEIDVRDVREDAVVVGISDELGKTLLLVLVESEGERGEIARGVVGGEASLLCQTLGEVSEVCEAVLLGSCQFWREVQCLRVFTTDPESVHVRKSSEIIPFFNEIKHKRPSGRKSLRVKVDDERGVGFLQHLTEIRSHRHELD
jgi:hypothetical protein